jgi:crotonobetainyl-CoA:carnitine CoA-transferase CaiB-like acyl-CoA transferase
MAICDKLSGLTFSQLMTAALFERATTGRGQRLHLSMLHAAIGFLWPDAAQDAIFLDGDDSGGRRASTPPVRRSADGWISISLNQDYEFRALCRALRIERLCDDPRFATAGPRSINGQVLQDELAPLLESRRTAELVELFTANRIPHAVIRQPGEVHEDPQVAAIEALEISDHPVAGRMRLPRPVGDFGASPLASPSPAPGLGEHTDDVLRSLGVSDADIAALRAARAVA